MKHIKLYEFTSLKYQIEKISYVDLISEDDEYYTIQVNSGNKLTVNMQSQLNWIFKNNYITFYCKNHEKYEEFKVRGSDLIRSENKLVFCFACGDCGFEPVVLVCS